MCCEVHVIDCDVMSCFCFMCYVSCSMFHLACRMSHVACLMSRRMAPESLLRQEYSEKSDVYAFGICLFEILMRQTPYAQHADLEAALRVRKTTHMQHSNTNMRSTVRRMDGHVTTGDVMACSHPCFSTCRSHTILSFVLPSHRGVLLLYTN